jgi:formylglycine-generating enzyme required for sulfatase activity
MKKNKTGNFTRGVAALFVLILTAGLFSNVQANDIRITNVQISQTSAIPGDEFVVVQFDLEWDNSFRVADGVHSNWDAAWLFMKYKDTEAKNVNWGHATLSSNLGEHTVSNPDLTIALGRAGNLSMSERVIGVYVYRNAVGDGPVSAQVSLTWRFGLDLLTTFDEVDIKVFGIEMVYVPSADFYVGDGETDFNQFQVTQITTSNASAAGGFPTGEVSPNAAFPNGHGAFYMMKHNVTQQMYVDFLNTLRYSGQQARTGAVPSHSGLIQNVHRHKIKVVTPGISGVRSAVYETENPFVAINYVNWADISAYLDWAGLRPMTELEYEKAARGPQMPAPRQYVWGSTQIHPPNTPYTFSNASLENEEVTNASTGNLIGNMMYNEMKDNIGGPSRVGIFARAATTRAEAGSSYYGVMDLGGNVWEIAVNIARAEGRAFTGNHGNGLLTANGASDVAGWPQDAGMGIRGTSWNTGRRMGEISNRRWIDSLGLIINRADRLGARGVRTAP